MVSNEKLEKTVISGHRDGFSRAEGLRDYIHNRIDNLIGITEWCKTDLLKKGDHKRASSVD